jgi:heme-degrading monooxygenase HmoA
MFSVIFEVQIKHDRVDQYLSLASQLKPILERIDGFIDNERFESRRRPGWLLSHSTWRDEKALVRWRTEGEHHQLQERGRYEVFNDYRIRVGNVSADTHPPSGHSVGLQRLDETQVGAAKFVTLTEVVPQSGAALAGQIDRLPAELGLSPSDPDVVEYDLFASIYNEGKIALLVSWRSQEAACRWSPTPPFPGVSMRQRCVRVVRDYGMFDRREAPQYYRPVPGAPAH